ncbi:hypothetical protein Y1Q_0019160 [Alligator mississippiensis]|uniref:Uncharacterized protein n=1 Tax=Alligator mississippiensis TaxID=8496 RepID=A0A151MQ69_ALLMI|nr:hypothetical protein Y1Q_0019160 [Alligator mississippiensis]
MSPPPRDVAARGPLPGSEDSAPYWLLARLAFQRSPDQGQAFPQEEEGSGHLEDPQGWTRNEQRTRAVRTTPLPS